MAIVVLRIEKLRFIRGIYVGREAGTEQFR
jgi:hypothetical protein